MTRYQHFEPLALIAVSLFATVSALGGGIALLVGAIEFPQEWLDRSMFHSYTIPAIVLAAVVGGSQVIAAAAMILREDRRWKRSSQPE